jgi:hypothetical protein
MNTLSADAIAEAFALSNARGADLLLHLGNFGVWRGDLAAMRGDDPRATDVKTESGTAPSGADFQETFLLAKALDLLTPECRSVLTAAYAEQRSGSTADRVTRGCERRLLEIYESLLAEHSAR